MAESWGDGGWESDFHGGRDSTRGGYCPHEGTDFSGNSTDYRLMFFASGFLFAESATPVQFTAIRIRKMLAELQGSEKQISWAKRIRTERMNRWGKSDVGACVGIFLWDSIVGYYFPEFAKLINWWIVGAVGAITIGGSSLCWIHQTPR